ncbi:12430_t:CDS:1, partial [Racocetra fulgida]
PGWNDKNHLPGAVASITTNSTTPQDCCKACIADTNCFQWAFHELHCHTYHDLDNTCSTETISLSASDDEGGIIRCNDGSGSECRF